LSTLPESLLVRFGLQFVSDAVRAASGTKIHVYRLDGQESESEPQTQNSRQVTLPAVTNHFNSVYACNAL